MTHQFSQVPQARIPRSSFNRSHGHKLTFDGGKLVPIFLDEALPGDSMSLRASMFGRLATPIKPVMDTLIMQSFFFFVPNRLVWGNWQKFNGEQDNPGDSTDFTIPAMTGSAGSTEVQAGSLADYFGLPLGTDFSNDDISALPWRAYKLIYNEWFRDQNLQESVPFSTGNGPDPSADPTYGSFYEPSSVLNRGKRHDYFTSCLPWPQKGDPVTVPLGDQAPVYGIGVLEASVAAAGGQGLYKESGGRLSPDWQANFNSNLVDIALEATESGAAGVPTIYADLSAATGFTINQLRQSFQIQKLLERDARGGTRYTEIVRSHFGVISPDARLQRPEFLGGGTSLVNINPVEQNTPSDIVADITPQGNLAAYGTVSASGHGFSKSFTEHGWIIGLVNVRADLSYQQGINRMWSRKGRYDFYWPALAHIGEQAVLNKEIYNSNDPLIDDDIFGYQERYAEYRYKPSQITSLFRSDANASLDVWHWAQDFASLPVLGDQFIQDNPPIDRTIAVQSEPHMLLDIYYRYKCARPMPLYGTPGLIDHF